MSRFVLVNTLRSLGCEVEQAGSAEEAWSILNRTAIRVVVADWRMPGEDGLEFCRRVRAREGDYVYFILLTEAEASESNQSLANDAGVDDFLSKPVQAYELGNRLRVAERILRYTVQVRQLESFLPICGYCKKVRNDGNYWEQIEAYISKHTGTPLSQGICPDCYETNVIPELPPEPRLATAEVEAPRTARPTLGMIARALGVSAAAVSMALRNHPRISVEMRERVAAKARELGYRPDPEIRKAMRHLRVNRKPGFKSVIYGLALGEGSPLTAYDSNLIRGCETRAVQRGYGFVLTRLRGPEDSERLQRVLLSRGVEGLVLFLGEAGFAELDRHFDWQRFSVLSVAHGGDTEFDAIRPHWGYAAKRAYRELAARGFRRIGLVVDAGFDAALDWSVSSAIRGLDPETGSSVSPYLFAPGDAAPVRVSTFGARAPAMKGAPCGWEKLVDWFEEHRPDALIVDHDVHARTALAALGPERLGASAVVVLNRDEDSSFSGLAQRTFEIGTRVVESLCDKIEGGERGRSTSPIVTKVKGQWVPRW